LSFSVYSEILECTGVNIVFPGEISYGGTDRVVFMKAIRVKNSQIVAAAGIKNE